MEGEFQFSIQSLLTQKDGRVSGAMSPMLFAKEMAIAQDFKFNRLARVWFGDERTHQHREDGGFTGYDTLVIGTVYSNDVWLSLWVDTGLGGLPVAMAFGSDFDIEVTPAYREANFEKKLNGEELEQIFRHLFGHMEELNIKQE